MIPLLCSENRRAAETNLTVIKHDRLAGRDGALFGGKLDMYKAAGQRNRNALQRLPVAEAELEAAVERWAELEERRGP